MESETTPTEEGATGENPWHADLFGTMNLEQVKDQKFSNKYTYHRI